ncbi:hypothetical protein [Pseudomonas sp. S2_D06]
MRFTYEVKCGMYIYKGPQGHGGIAYSLDQINQRLTKAFGASGYELVRS